jgi:hypothetical protein
MGSLYLEMKIKSNLKDTPAARAVITCGYQLAFD